MAASSADTEALDAWTTVYKRLYHQRRVPHPPNGTESTDVLLKALHRRYPLSGQPIVEVILLCAAQPPICCDPLVPIYLEQSLRLLHCNTAHVLTVLLGVSRYAPNRPLDGGRNKTIWAPAIETVINLLITLFKTEERPMVYAETRSSINALQSWLKACNIIEAMLGMNRDALQAPGLELTKVVDALALLTVSMLSNTLVKSHLGKLTEAEKSEFKDVLNTFATTLSQYSQSGQHLSLQEMSGKLPLVALGADGNPQFASADVQTSVANLEIVTTRAGLYVYLNAALYARPLVNDSALVNHLHARYPTDKQEMIVQLIIASFDSLVNALHSNEHSQAAFVHRSFLSNKLPLLLTNLIFGHLSSGLCPPLTAELCMQQALSRIEFQPFRSSPSGESGITSALRSTRQEFLNACLLHQLINDDAHTSLSEPSGPGRSQRAARYHKESLFTQITGNVHRAEHLVKDLDGMQGNAGAISLALVDAIQHYCASRETIPLKTLCNALSRRLALVDVVLQYARVGSILIPLSKVLDEWTPDEDQSELQPAYEEFAAVLLLVLGLLRRYQIAPSQLSALPSDTFVARLQMQWPNSILSDQLSAEQSRQLTKWVKALYQTDEKGETSGISDETMSGCPPQAFYQLVPTLFDNSVMAYRERVIDLKTLKGGLEFLLEPFLLPSIIGGIDWLRMRLWTSYKEADALLPILDKLLRPSSVPGDAQAMHTAILSMTAPDLLQTLRQLERKQPGRKDITELLEVLKQHTDGQQLATSGTEQNYAHRSSSAGGSLGSIADLVSRLTAWSGHSDLMDTPAKYSHRTVDSVLRMCGADRVLMAIIEEVNAQTSAGLGPQALEVATALISAPAASDDNMTAPLDVNQIHPQASRLSLRQALKFRVEDTKTLLRETPATCETLIRLGRLVDAQTVVSPIPPLSMPLTNVGTDELMEGIDMTTAGEMAESANAMNHVGSLDATTATEDFAAVMDQSMDLDTSGADMGAMGDAGALSIDLSDNLFGSQDMFSMDAMADSQAQPQQAQGGLGGQESAGTVEEDIFAGLDFGGMGDDDLTY